MKRLNKFFVMVILTLAIALGSFSVMATAFAEEVKVESTTQQIVVDADDVELELGETARLGFYANGNCNVAGYHFTLVLPSNVTFSNFELAGVDREANFQYSVNGEEVSVICNSSNEEHIWGMTMFYIEVVAREVGYGEIWFRNASIVDINANQLECRGDSVGITVLGEQTISIIKGDVDGDERVTVADLMLMQRYVIGTLGDEANFSTDAADVNGDYDINLTDCQHVQRYLIGKISFEELQALSGNGGGTDTPIEPEYPTGEMVYSVHVGAELLKDALRIDYEYGDTYFDYNGETLVGSTTFASMIEESEPAYKAMFVPYSSKVVYEFVLSDGYNAKLDAFYDLEKLVEEQEFNFNTRYAGNYNLFDGKEEFGDVEVFEDGIFCSTVYFDMNGKQSSRVINGYIEIIDEKTAYAHVFGLYAKEIVILPNSGFIMPTTQQREFELQYIYPDGMTYVQTVYYAVDENSDVYDVAKMLAHQNMPSDFNMNNLEINKEISGKIIVRVSSANSGSGDVTEGKNITFFMIIRNDKTEMCQPMGNPPIASQEDLNQMLLGMANPPAETGMIYVGTYVDADLTIPYTEDMGLNVDVLYISMGLTEDAGKLLTGMGGTFGVKEFDQESGTLNNIDATLTLNDKDSTFTFVMGDKTITGEVILEGGSYDKNGQIDRISITLISNDHILLGGEINYTNNVPCFEMYNNEDFSSYETKEELKDIAGEYTVYMTAMGIEMGYCTAQLKDNGVIVLQILYMKQLGAYELFMTVKGAEIYIYADSETTIGTIDFDRKTITVDMSSSMGGGNSSSGTVDKERFSATIFAVMDGVVIAESETPIYTYDDTYEALLEGIYGLIDGAENVKIYLDPELKEELTASNFKTVNTVYYIAIDMNGMTDVNGTVSAN